VTAVDPYDPKSVARAIQGCGGVVNLQGQDIFGARWNARFKQLVRDSRVESTRALVRAMASVEPRPEVLVSASAVGIYGVRDPADVIDEDRLDADRYAPDDFLADVCCHWESAAREAERLGVRVVRLRTGVVLGRGGGALVQMEKPFRMFVGGPVGSGRQAMSWIHADDLARLVVFALRETALHGPVNAVAPNPVTNREFARALGRVLHRPSFAPTPKIALRIALGQVASVVTGGQRVVPTRALQSGFAFRYPTVEAALGAIYGGAAAR
jgi:uncharacterized protein (TIGR01777 family)